MRLNKRAQVAAEFSLTSMFSIIALLVIAAGLWYFGIFNFALPNKCILPAGITCVDHRATRSDIGLVLMNNMGSDIVIDKLTISDCQYNGPTLIENNEMEKFEFPCSLKQGSVRSTLYLSFRKKHANLTHSWEGEFMSRVP
jgi:hypothetical protein